MKIININLRGITGEGYYVEVVTDAGIMKTSQFRWKSEAKRAYAEIRKLQAQEAAGASEEGPLQRRREAQSLVAQGKITPQEYWTILKDTWQEMTWEEKDREIKEIEIEA